MLLLTLAFSHRHYFFSVHVGYDNFLFYSSTDTFTAWKDGLLKYKSIPFTELIENLKDIYQVEIRIDDERLADPSITVSGTFNQKKSIEQILKVISHSLPIRLKVSCWFGVITIFCFAPSKRMEPSTRVAVISSDSASAFTLKCVPNTGKTAATSN